ncbi:hypothetical protein BLOT_006752 [Blomia tropicalis]|nr:hypothetical protein BLOT_006752 [Blomia tropicalis]
MVRNESEPTESEVRKKATPLLPSSNLSDHHQSCEKPTTKKILKTLETDTFNDRDNVQSSISSSITEDIYAVVDKSRKLRKKSISETTKSSSTTTMDTTTSTTATTTTTPSTTTGTIVSSNTNVIASPEPNGGNHQSEQRPVPPVRSTSTSERRPELKPKPPIRVASIQKPEVSPKPKNLSAMGTNSPIPNTTSGYGHRLCNIKPSIAARQAQLISCTSPQPPTMTPSPAPSH